MGTGWDAFRVNGKMVKRGPRGLENKISGEFPEMYVSTVNEATRQLCCCALEAVARNNRNIKNMKNK